MGAQFISAQEVVREELDWGRLAWACRPASTGARQLVVIEVTLAPGKGHAFHKHPQQEEVIYVIEGQVEQWLEQEKRVLGSGDVVFIPADAVHASFNTSNHNAKLLAILGPAMAGPTGYEVIEVASQPPWNTLR